MMEFKIDGHDVKTPFIINGEISILRWLSEALTELVNRNEEDGRIVISYLEPTEERVARQAAQEREWEDNLLTKADEIRTARAANGI